MKKRLKTNNVIINRIVSVVISLLIGISFSFAESRVIVEESSSIIIESRSMKTKLLVNNIETVKGGKYIENNYSYNNDKDNLNNVEVVPESFVIENANPNPFNPTTNIKYGIQKISDIDIAIFDLTGRLVNSYRINAQKPGWHKFTWNGTDASQKQVSTGIYLVTMRAGKNIQKQKVTFLK